MADIEPALRQRVSPRTFDRRHELTETDVELLLEAARWAPSAGNSQPWAFVAARRGGPTHELVVPHLAASSARWAPDAALLVVNVVHRYFEEPDWEVSEFADYDLGQAVAHMTVQAQSMGLSCRQFRAFDVDGLTTALGIAPGWQVMTITAIGVGAEVDDSHRERRSLDDLQAAARSAS